MHRQNIHSIGPSQTPKVVKYLILTTLGISISSALFANLLPLQYLLGLSLSGIEKGFFWQILSYVFIQPVIQGISFSYLMHLVFNMYLLWIVGTSIVERSTPGQFLALYLFSSIFSGLVCTALMIGFQNHGFIGGSSAALYSLLIAWMILYPDMQISLFFVVPFKAKWLILGLLCSNLLIDLSNGDFLGFSLYLSTSVFGYLFSVMKWKQYGPFVQLHDFEKVLMKAPFSWVSRMQKGPKAKKRNIFDFRSGRPVMTDDEFMDKMLSKISTHGESSLSDKEKQRMHKIAKKKKLRETV